MNEILVSKLLERGFEKTESTDWMTVMLGPKYRVQILTDSEAVRVGFNETFDRWANSTDYETTVDLSVEAVAEFIAVVDGLKQCRYCDSWHTPHQVANRPVCEACFKNKHKSRNKRRERT
jgi:hypothetical protein